MKNHKRISIARPANITKRTLLAAAVLSIATHCIAQAENGPVTLYGNLYVNYESVRAVGGTTPINDFPTRNRVSSNSSNFGLRGTEKLGGGLDAWYQIEMGSVAMDAGGGALAGRNSAVGLRGSMGSLFLGQWDTPYKNATSNLDPFGNTSIAGYTNIMGGGTTSTSNNAATRQGFDRRQRNVVQYWTPEILGFNIRTAYSANEERDTCGAVRCNPSLVSAAASYRKGETTFAVAYERHNHYANSATARTRDTAMKIGGRYVFGGQHGISAVFETIKFTGNLAATALPKAFTVGAATEAKLNSTFLAYKGDFGKHNIRVSWGQNRELALNSGSAPNTKASMKAIGYGYEFSRRTEGMVFYTVVSNASASRNDFAVNGLLAANNNNNGADPRGFAIGIRHRF
jgi:predicted porin